MVIICDFTPRVPVYNRHLIEELSILRPCYYLTNPYYENSNLKTSSRISITPRFWGNIENNNIVKFFYYIYNWLLLFYLIFFSEKSIKCVHFQWLALYEKISIEKYLIRFLKKKVVVIYTIHNVIPHNSNPTKIKKYLSLYEEMPKLIVHTQELKDFLVERKIKDHEDISVIYHGLFFEKEFKKRKVSDKVSDSITILQYGGFSYYKGLDLLLDAAKMINSKEIHFRAVGKIDKEFSKVIFSKKQRLSNFSFKFDYLSDRELIAEIENADILVFPYRSITTSGALMIGLSSEKKILTSDLPFFVEYLKDKGTYFKNGDTFSLKEAILQIINSENKVVNLDKFNWEKIAKKTLLFYSQEKRQ